MLSPAADRPQVVQAEPALRNPFVSLFGCRISLQASRLMRIPLICVPVGVRRQTVTRSLAARAGTAVGNARIEAVATAGTRRRSMVIDRPPVSTDPVVRVRKLVDSL